MPVSKGSLRGVTNATSLSFIILIEISSQPCALLGLSDLMIFRIFSSEMTKSFIKIGFLWVSSGISLHRLFSHFVDSCH